MVNFMNTIIIIFYPDFDENRISIIYDSSISDFRFISEFVILPIMNNINALTDIEKIKREIILAPSIGDVKSEGEAVEHILREAGIRLPQPIGSTLSIVGALILGDVSVQSGLSSHVTVFIVALTSISSLLLPRISIAIFIWSIIVLVFSGFLGLPGFYMGFILFCSHLASLTSCGYPYLYPLGTMKTFKYKDIPNRGDLDRINDYIFQEDDLK